MNNEGRIPPNAETDERAINGAIINLGVEAFHRAGITSSEFYNSTNAAFFKCVEELVAEGIEPDEAAILSRLDGKHGVDRAYIHDLKFAAGSAANAPFYADKIRRTSMRRRLRDLINLTDKELDNGQVEEDIFGHLIDEAKQISEGGGLNVGSAVVVNMADVEPKAIDWLWPNRVALGKLTILVGDPGGGKSTATCDMSARVTQGYRWPDGDEPNVPG